MVKINLKKLLAGVLVLTSFFSLGDDGSKPLIVTTIKPLAIIAATASNGNAAVRYIQSSAQTTCDIYLSPLLTEKFSSADSVIRVSPIIETHLNKFFKRMSGLNLITASELEMRWPASPNAGSNPGSLHRDLHFWLDPWNANVLATEIQKRLGLKDNQIIDSQLLATYQLTLRDYRDRTVIAHHDAFGHFANAFSLKPFQSIRDTTGSIKGIASNYQLRANAQANMPNCILVEPQYQPRETKLLGSELQLPLNPIDLQGMSAKLT